MEVGQVVDRFRLWALTPPPLYPDGNPKTAAGEAKVSLCFIPPIALVEMAKAFELGAKKYGAYNWRTAGVSELTYLNAILRHTLQVLDGEDIDPESMAKHLGHIMASCAIILDAESLGMLKDNRPPKGKAPDAIREKKENP